MLSRFLCPYLSDALCYHVFIRVYTLKINSQSTSIFAILRSSPPPHDTSQTLHKCATLRCQSGGSCDGCSRRVLQRLLRRVFRQSYDQCYDQCSDDCYDGCFNFHRRSSYTSLRFMDRFMNSFTRVRAPHKCPPPRNYPRPSKTPKTRKPFVFV